MMKNIFRLISGLLALLPLAALASNQFIPDKVSSLRFYKTELNSGFSFYKNDTRESFITDLSNFTENRSNYGADYFYSLNWFGLDNKKQEISKILIGIGPVYATGNSTFSEQLIARSADNRIFGATLSGKIDFSGRYYYEGNSYALVEAAGFGKIEKLQINSKGYEANLVSSAQATRFEENFLDNRLRYGIKTKAGWGIGQPEVANHLMEAEYILNSFYKGRLFSPGEKNELADKIGRIKNSRKLQAAHNTEKEAEEVARFLNSNLLLTIPGELVETWKYGEFSPRFDGNRFEVGPFFNYFNREPDFVYGGFLGFESDKYLNFRWSRLFKAELSYNRYKTRDWLQLETVFQFDFYQNLRSKFSLGLKYIPVLEVKDTRQNTSFQNVFIPTIGYFSQLNEKTRMELALVYNITNQNDYFIQGPEFSLSIYRSRY